MRIRGAGGHKCFAIYTGVLPGRPFLLVKAQGGVIAAVRHLLTNAAQSRLCTTAKRSATNGSSGFRIFVPILYGQQTSSTLLSELIQQFGALPMSSYVYFKVMVLARATTRRFTSLWSPNRSVKICVRRSHLSCTFRIFPSAYASVFSTTISFRFNTRLIRN